MTWLSASHVHTTGVNWELWAAIAGPVLTVLGGVANLLRARLNRLAAQIETQTDDLRDRVDEKTWQVQRQLVFHQAEVTQQHRELGERVARLEGPMRQVIAEREANGGTTPPSP